jgi:sugar phosphate isomerase/epimerase
VAPALGRPDRPSFASVLEEAHAAKINHLVLATIDPLDRKTLDDYKRAAEECNRVVAEAKKAGIQLAYHNHSFEFVPLEGTRAGYGVLMEEFSSDIKFESMSSGSGLASVIR